MSTAGSSSQAADWSFSISTGQAASDAEPVRSRAPAPTSDVSQEPRLEAPTQTLDGLEWEVEAATAVLDLVSKLAAADSADAAGKRLAAEVQAYLGCSRVAVALARPNGNCRLVAISDVAEIDRRSELAIGLESALDEACFEGRLTVWPGETSRGRAALPAHERLAAAATGAGLISSPLTVADGRTLGAWVLLGAQGFAQDARHRRFVDVASGPIAGVLDVLSRGRGWLPARWRPRIRSKLRFEPRLVLSLAAIVSAILCFPVRDRIGCECELQPTVRRFVAAPFEGVFEKSLVRPGDRVKRGQVLCRMDGREIRLELSALEAEQQRAGKSRDVNLATSKVAEAQIDQLEMARFDLKRQLLERRQQQLNVESPIAGIVLSGDLERSQGARVKLGQPLYEVGPLDKMVAELAIADEDISRVSDGDVVTIRFDAYPGADLSAQISKIHPRSEVRQTDNVFIAEAVLDNRDQQLRPGMKGAVTIQGRRQKLAWTLFGRPWQRLGTWIGW